MPPYGPQTSDALTREFSRQLERHVSEPAKAPQSVPLQRFFESPAADRLMDRSICPPEIAEFLRQEQRLLNALRDGVEMLIEVGCMDGRNLDWAVTHNKRYIGVDISGRHISAARKSVIARGLSVERYRFILGCAEELDTVLSGCVEPTAPAAALILFPFNVFGVVSDVERVICAVRNSGLPFLISAYQVTDEATACRFEYYGRCGYRGLREMRDERGVRFETGNGFQTLAYNPEYLIELWRGRGVAVSARIWSQLNVAYGPTSMLATLHLD